MPKLSKITINMLHTIDHAARASGFIPYLYGDLARAIQLDQYPADGRLVEVVLSYEHSNSVDDFYQSLSKKITINREIEHFNDLYSFVSSPYVVECQLRQNFNVFDNDIAVFNVDALFIEMGHNADPAPETNELLCFKQPDEWDITHVIGFAAKLGEYPDRIINPDQRAALDEVQLLKMRHPFGVNIAEKLIDLLLTANPGNAFLFLSSFTDGKDWLATQFIELASRYSIALNEDFDLREIISSKKAELLNVYSEYFKVKREDSEWNRQHSILTYLKLLFDSPSLTIETPYIDRVSVFAAPETFTVPVENATVTTFADDRWACCQEGNICTEVDKATCTTLRGIWHEGLLCDAVNCSVDIPGDCEYPPCPPCDPAACGDPENGGEACCCCSSVDIVSATALQCHKQIIISCNRDGTGPGPDADGIEQVFNSNCSQCTEVCEMIINSSGPDGCINPPNPALPKVCCGELPTPWFLDPPTPCSCDCARYDGDGVCSLHCMSCSGKHAYCRSIVTPGGQDNDCAYDFTIEPGPECCGSPAGFDVIFVIDDTGSMGSEIKDVKNGIIGFVQNGINRGILSRLALVTFKDDVWVYGFNDDGTYNTNSQVGRGGDEKPRPGPVDFTTDATEFEALVGSLTASGGGDGPENIYDGSMQGLHYNMPGAFGNIMITVCDNSARSDTTREQLIDFANSENYKIFFVGPATGAEQIAIQTGGLYYDLTDADWDQIFLDASSAAGIFPSSCACVDFTPLPIIRAVGDPSDPDNYFPQCACDDVSQCLPNTPGELPSECYEFPIPKCVSPDTAEDCDGICDIPFGVNVCGTTITITPTETNMTCCGTLDGFGCTCPGGGGECPDYQCCGAECDELCDWLAIPFPTPIHSSVGEAQQFVWNNCLAKATGSCGDDCLLFPTGECEDDGVTPIEYFKEKSGLFDEVATIYANCGGEGGACCIGINCTTVSSESECDGVWMGYGTPCTPNPCGGPGAVEFDCITSECNYDDQCIVGEPVVGVNRVQDQCDEIYKGCSSVGKPSIAILNNGVGLIAYETMVDNISTIKLQQFHTSVDFKLLANRTFGYGRLQNSLRWEDAPGLTQVSIATMWSYDELPVDIIQGTDDPADSDTWKDVIVFASGPLAGACFPVYHLDPAGVDDEKVAWYVKFLVQGDTELTSPFFSSDDYYQSRWYIYDYQTALRDAGGGINTDYKNLVGGAGASAQDYPFPEYLFGSSKDVDNILLGDRITDHIYNGERVPIANPKIDISKNYARPYENSQYAYLTYQALEDGKWNVYLKQIRLSEYSRDKLIDAATGSDNIIPIANPVDDLVEPGLGLAGVVYRITCVSDNCRDIGGNEFLMQRTVVMEVLLPDGREVLNPDPDGGNHGSLCPGVKAESFPDGKVFVKFVQSAVGDRCPDQFQFDDIFPNWATGQEYFVPLTAVSGQQLFDYLQRESDDGISVGQFDPPIEQGSTMISSSSVGADWYDDFHTDTNNWSVIESEPFDVLSQFKGLDISGPILISTNETGHCTNPRIQVDYNNHVFIVYEHTDTGIQNIRLVGTKEVEDELPTGVSQVFNPDDSLNYFFDKDDFVYSVDITSSGEGSNQLPDLYIDLNNVLHLAWQSNRDKVWEIYYANSTNNFAYKRITKHEGRSLKPSITSNPSGNLFITWHDNRYGNYEIMMAYHPGVRVIPLYQQDPYLASLRNFHDGWSHTTDVLPLNVVNDSDGPICYSKFDVNFYEDRNLEHLAFTVSSSDYPFAFTLPGSESDVTTADLSDIDTQWVTTYDYTYSGPTIITQNFVAVSNEIDTFLEDSTIKTILIPELNTTGGCSFGTIELRASNLTDDPDADTQWSAEYSLSGREGELIDLETLGVTETVAGRYKQIRLKWDCDVFTDTFSVIDGESDAHVESELTWTNDAAEVRLGHDSTASSATWGEITTSTNTTTAKSSDLIDISGTMYMSWAAGGNSIKFAEFDPSTSSFINEEVVLASTPNISIIEISIENIFGIPAIAYIIYSTTSGTYDVAYATRFGGSWNSYTVVTGLPTFVWSQVSLFDNNDQPGIIVHFDGGGASSINFYASTSQGQSWQPAESVATNVDDTGEISAVMISGVPAVTYLDTTTGNRVYNTRAGSWGVPVTMSVTTPISATRCTIMQYNTHPLFFFGDSSGIGMRWSRYDGVTWTGDQIIDGAAEIGHYKPMLVNSIPTIAYYEASGSAEFDLKYAELTSLPLNTWDINVIDASIVADTSAPNHWVPSTTWTGEPPGGETVAEHAAIMPLVDTSNIVYIEEFDVAGLEKFDAYFRFDNFDVPVDTTIISSHMEMKARVASGAAKSVIRLLDEVDTREFEDNTTVQIPIAAAADDAELEIPDLWSIGSNTIKFGSDGGSDYYAYLRFLLNIPVNSRVIESYVEFTPAATDTGDAHATIALVDGSSEFADTHIYSVAIDSQSGDADYRISDERWENSADTIRFGESAGETYEAYLRFYITGIPTYALISSASITLQSESTVVGDSDVAIKLLDYGNIESFPDTTVLQFQIAAGADDADFNTEIEEWRNDLSSVRFGVDIDDYNAYMRFNVDIDPDLKYIAARLRITPAADSSGTSSTMIKLLNRNDDWPSADHTEFPTMLTTDIYASSSDDDAMAEVIDNLPKRWENSEGYIWWGTEHASDGDHVWDGYVRFDTFTAGIADQGLGRPKINRAHIEMQSEGPTSTSTTIIHGINRNVERSGGDGFPHYTSITAEIPSAASDAFLADDADWTINEGTVQFGNDGSNTYDAILRFIPEDKDSSVRLERYDYISESYLSVIAVNNTSIGANAQIQLINDCSVDEFVESDSGTFMMDNETYVSDGLSPDAYVQNDTTWFNKANFVRFGTDGADYYDGYLRIRVYGIPEGSTIVSATLFSYPYAAELNASDIAITLIDENSAAAFKGAESKSTSANTTGDLGIADIAYTYQAQSTLDPSLDYDEPDEEVLASGFAIYGDYNVWTEYVVGDGSAGGEDPVYPFETPTTYTDTRSYGAVSGGTVHRIGDLTWTTEGLYVAWVDNDTTPDAPNYKLMVSKLVKNGSDWEWKDSTEVDSDVYGDVTMLTVDNDPCISYLRDNSGTMQLCFARKFGAGGSWPTHSTVTVVAGASGSTIGSPHCIEDDSLQPKIAYVIGTTGVDSTNSIFVASSTDGGATFVNINTGITTYGGTQDVKLDCLRITPVNSEIHMAYSRYNTTSTEIEVYFAYYDGSWNDVGRVYDGATANLQNKVGNGFDLISYDDLQTSTTPVPVLFMHYSVAINDRILWARSTDRGTTWSGERVVTGVTLDPINIRAVVTYEQDAVWTNVVFEENTSTWDVQVRRQSDSLNNLPASGTWVEETALSNIGTDEAETIAIANVRDKPAILFLQPESSPTYGWDSAPVVYWEQDFIYSALARHYIEGRNSANDYEAPYSDAIITEAKFTVTPQLQDGADNDNDANIKMFNISSISSAWSQYEMFAWSLPALFETPITEFTPDPGDWTAVTVDITGAEETVQNYINNRSGMSSRYIGFKWETADLDDLRSAFNAPDFYYAYTYPQRDLDLSAPEVIWSIQAGEWTGSNPIGVDITDLVDYWVNNKVSSGYMGIILRDANSSVDSLKELVSVEGNSTKRAYIDVVWNELPNIDYRSTTVNWSPNIWTDSDIVTSPDIRLLIQDYVDRCDPGVSSAAMGFGIQHVSGSVLKTFAAYEGSGYGEPSQLYIEYSPYINVTPYLPDKQVSWSTGTWADLETVTTPDLRGIVKPWFDSYFSFYGTKYIGFRISTATDILKSVKSSEGGTDIKLHIEYSPEGTRTTDGSGISWVDATDWDTVGSGDAVEVTSPDLLTLIDTVFTSDSWRYHWDQYGYGTSGIGYYLDEEHTTVNPDFTGQYIGFVIEEVSSSVLREFISKDTPFAAAILEIDKTEDGPRNRYMIDSATEHPGIPWTASSWDGIEKTADITALVTEYIDLPSYSMSGSYMGLVIENHTVGNPLKSFFAYDAAGYSGAQLDIAWTTGGALPPSGSSVDWSNIQDWSASVDQQSVDISTIVEEFLASSGYSGSGYIGLAIEDNSSSDVREFYAYESGSDPAQLIIHYTGPTRSTVSGIAWDNTSTPALDAWVIDEEVSTPELATLVQSYVNMDGYNSTASYAIGFVIEDNASTNLKRIVSYETAAGLDAAELLVSWRNNFDFTIELNSLATARLCLGSGESSTGSLDLTPNIRLDSQGNKTVESPLPIDYHPNWTYFTAIEATTDNNDKVIMDQKKSISCESCSAHSVETSWDFETCSLTVEISNTNVLPMNVNIAVLLYADEERNSLAGQLSTFAWGDIDRFTMDDLQPASDFQENGEFVIAPGGVLRMLAWPTLGPNSGLVCGLKYFYEININSDGGTVPDTTNSTGEWVCSCGSERWSGRFEEQQQDLTTMTRWRSSGEGLADIRLTETKSDNFSPHIQIRPDFAGLVMYESNRDDSWNLYVSSFAYQPSHKMYASSAESIISPWSEPIHKSDITVKNSDGDHIAGLGGEFKFDQYGNLFMVASMPFNTFLMDGSQEDCNRFSPDTMQYILVHRCGLDDFSFEEVKQDDVERVCEQEDITKEIYSISSPTFNKLIRMIRVREEFVKYHVSRVKNSLPVVN